MKIRVIKNAYYNLEYLKAGKIIDFEGKKLPSWAEKINGEKKAENKTPEESKTPKSNNENKTDGNENEKINTPDNQKEKQNELTETEKQQYLEMLINEAMDKNIVIEDADKKSVEEQISELEEKLGKGK